MKTTLLLLVSCLTAFSQDIDYSRIRNGPGVSVKKFGALGNGSHNDTAAITRAIASVCGEGGGILFFPLGTYIVSPEYPGANLFPLCSNMTIRGPGTIKIADGAGAYTTLFGSPSDLSCLSNMIYEGFTIDENSANNPFVLSPFHPRIAIYTCSEGATGATGTNVTINNVHITNVIAEWAIVVVASNSRITNNLIDHVGGGGTDFDTSLLYVGRGGKGTLISGNKISADAPGTHFAHTAIEVHDACLISNNTLTNFDNGVILTGQGNETLVGLTANNNTILNANSCMSLWSFSGFGPTDFGLDGATIQNNTCTIKQQSYMPQNVGYSSGYIVEPDSNLPLKNITISNNIVTFADSLSSAELQNQASIGIGYWDAQDSATNGCFNCSFSNNTVVNAPLAAYRYSAGGSNINFDNNIAINPGSTLNVGASSAFKSGLIVSPAFPITGHFSVNGGSYTDTRPTARMVGGIVFSALAAVNAVVDGPTVTCLDLVCASMTAAIVSNSVSATPAFVRAIVNAPASTVIPIGSAGFVKAGSSVYSIKTHLNYVYDGSTWNFSTPHLVPPTISGCGSGAVVAGNDRGGYVVVGTGSVTSCTITFGTAFTSQPTLTAGPVVNPIGITIFNFNGIGGDPIAYTHGFVISAGASAAFQGTTLSWSIPASAN